MQRIIQKLIDTRNLSDDELRELLSKNDYDEELFTSADIIRKKIYGSSVYIRGLIELTNHCKNGCYYCGISSSNKSLNRYRLTKEDILGCCKEGYDLGFRTFVMQGGEDPYYTDDLMCDIVHTIRIKYPDCAITLSIGEKERESYQRLFDAGANRYLLRHETADNELYTRLHPEYMSLENRKRCLFDLKDIGFQVGTGFMVGAPYQTVDNIISDIRFMQTLEPDMIGIGPFVPHHETAFALFPSGSVELTLRLIALFRHLFPYALIPATTALGTLAENGRERGFKAGANVVMPNLSPLKVRKLYDLYDNKVSSGSESAQCLDDLKKRAKSAGYNVVCDIGNVKKERAASPISHPDSM